MFSLKEWTFEDYKDEIKENTEVQKVLEFIKQESARSFVAPKS